MSMNKEQPLVRAQMMTGSLQIVEQTDLEVLTLVTSSSPLLGDGETFIPGALGFCSGRQWSGSFRESFSH